MIVFDPFIIGPSHTDHSRSTNLIKLEESGRIICPKCLSKTFIRGVEAIEEGIFNSYVNNFFEILDQHSEKDNLRRTALTVLDALIKKNPIKCRSEHEFHNYLRVLFKIMNNNLSGRDEFCTLSQILSSISDNFVNFSTTHLVFSWKAFHQALAYVEKDLIQCPVSFSNGARSHSLRFIGGVTGIIKTYLNILSRFRMSYTPELLLPLTTEDKMINHDRQQYKNNQLECLRIMTVCLIPNCWPHVKNLSGELEPEESESVGLFFEALRNCIQVATVLKNESFVNLVKEMDTIAAAHNLIRYNKSAAFRKQIRTYLQFFIFYHIETDSGTDKDFNRLMEQGDEAVETNHRNAIFFYNDPLKYDKIKFYILINYIAKKHNSTFFSIERIKKVLKIIDPERLGINSSTLIMRAYNFLVASSRVDRFDNISQFITRHWKKLRKEPMLRGFLQEYCYEGPVFVWATDLLFKLIPENPEFIKFVSTRTVDYAIQRAIKVNQLHIFMPLIMRKDRYGAKYTEYLKANESATTLVGKVLEIQGSNHRPADFGFIYDSIYKKLCDLLPAILYNLVYNYNKTEEKKLIDHILQVLDMIVRILSCHSDFDPIPHDDGAIIDLFTFMESIYKVEVTNVKLEEILILINHFIVEMMKRNHRSLMKILKNLNYYVLGYMHARLADYSRGDKLAESIGRLLITYDNIDYPLRQKVRLAEMELSAVNWMFSDNHHLHLLALCSLKDMIERTNEDSRTRACICTGLLHMIATKPELLDNKANLMEVLSVVHVEELKYNPLFNDMLNAVSKIVRNEIKMKLDDDEPTLSPAMSFSSSDSDDSNNDGASIQNILTQLEDNNQGLDDSCRIPRPLFVSSTVTDQHSTTVDIEDWETVAYDTNKSDDDF